MRALVTRPAEDAERIAGPLRHRGIDVLTEPLLVVTPAAAADVDLSDVAAFLMTSANGVRALTTALGDDPWAHRLPAFCVGDQTARVAEEAGFTRVFSAGGDVHSLAALVTKSFRTDAGTLLHVAGSKVAGDLKGTLEAAGFTVRRTVLYESRKAAALSADTHRALADRTVDAVLLYSPRTAAAFATLAKKAELSEALTSLSAYCLSQAVADQLADLPLARVRVSAEPTQDSLLAIFDEDYADQFQWQTATDDDAEGEQQMTERPKEDDGKKVAAESPDASGVKKDAPAKAASATPASAADGQSTKPESGNAATKAAASGAKAVPKTASRTEPPKDAPKAADQKAENGGGGGGPVVVGVLLLLVLLLGLWGSMPLWHGLMPASMQSTMGSFLPGASSAQDVETLSRDADDLRQALSSAKTTLSALERRVAALETRPAASGPVTVPDALTNRIGALEKALADQPNGLAQAVDALDSKVSALAGSTAQASSVLALSDKVAALDEQVRRVTSRQDKALAFLLAVGQLRQAAETGRPFDNELRVVKAIAPADFDTVATTATFADRAAAGVPTLPTLRQTFAARSPDIVRASMRGEDEATWWTRTLDRVGSVVTVTRTDGTAVGDGASAIVARAGALLEGGDLAGAVREMGTLTGGAKQAAAGWLTDAGARLAADTGLGILTSEALARVAAGTNATDTETAPAGREG